MVCSPPRSTLSRLAVIATVVVVTMVSLPGSALAAPGRRLWLKRLSGRTGTDADAADVAVSPDGSMVFATGFDSSAPFNIDYATAAYDSATGATMWTSYFDGHYHRQDSAVAVVASPDGSLVFVTGRSQGSSTHEDFATVAYDASTGAQRWATRFKGPYDDIPFDIGVSPDGSTVFVAGRSDTSSGSIPDYRTVAYDASTGAQVWTKQYGTPVVFDAVKAMGIDPDGSTVYVTGRNGSVATTIAYDSATGAQRWLMSYAAPAHMGDAATAIAVSPDGSEVLVAVDSVDAQNTDDFVTVAYDAATGGQIWSKHYGGATSGFFPSALGVSSSAVFVTGYGALGAGVGYATIAYDIVTGARLWASRYGAPENNNLPNALAVAPGGSQVFVTGRSDGTDGYPDYATVAYDAVTGAKAWTQRYDGPGHFYDIALAVAVNPDGSAVYVTGGSAGATNDEFATLAYRTT
jgi:outer membrane protein assembly factor BamB